MSDLPPNRLGVYMYSSSPKAFNKVTNQIVDTIIADNKKNKSTIYRYC